MVFSVEDRRSAAEPVENRCSAIVMVTEPVENRRSVAVRRAEDTGACGLPPRVALDGRRMAAGAGVLGVVVLLALEETRSEYDVLRNCQITHYGVNSLFILYLS